MTLSLSILMSLGLASILVAFAAAFLVVFDHALHVVRHREDVRIYRGIIRQIRSNRSHYQVSNADMLVLRDPGSNRIELRENGYATVFGTILPLSYLQKLTLRREIRRTWSMSRGILATSSGAVRCG